MEREFRFFNPLECGLCRAASDRIEAIGLTLGSQTGIRDSLIGSAAEFRTATAVGNLGQKVGGQRHSPRDAEMESGGFQLQWLRNAGYQQPKRLVPNVISNSYSLLAVAAQAIRKAYEIDWKPNIVPASVAASVESVIAPAGSEKAIGAVTAGYLKDPTDKVWKSDRSYLDWVVFMKQWYPGGSLIDSNNVYGYSIA